MKTLFIEPGSPRENGYVETFNGKTRDELLNPELIGHPVGSKDAMRSVGRAVQHDQTAQCLGIWASGAIGTPSPALGQLALCLRKWCKKLGDRPSRGGHLIGPFPNFS